MTAAFAVADPVLSVGVLAADLGDLRSSMSALPRDGVWAHVDVMDGQFCPALTVGTPMIAALRDCGLPVDAHLMVHEPRRMLTDVVDAGAAIVNVHAESARELWQTMKDLDQLAREHDGLVRSIAISPDTPVTILDPVLDLVDLVLVLAVDPTRPGRRIPTAATADRVSEVRRAIDRGGVEVLLGVDGGVTLDNIADIAAWSPDVVVSGSAVFGAADPAGAVHTMRSQLSAARETTPNRMRRTR